MANNDSYYCFAQQPPVQCVNIGTEDQMDNEYWCPRCEDFMGDNHHRWIEGAAANKIAEDCYVK